MPFSSWNLLHAAFPAGSYRFDYTRTYVSGGTTTVSKPLNLAGSPGFPAQVPKIIGTWINGKLQVLPGAMVIQWEPWMAPASADSRVDLLVSGPSESGWANLPRDSTSHGLPYLKANSTCQIMVSFVDVTDLQTFPDPSLPQTSLVCRAGNATSTKFDIEVLPDPNWPLLGFQPVSPALRSIAGTPAQTVAVGSAGRIAVLDNATGVWSTQDSAGGQSWNCVLYANSQYIAVGSGGSIRTSTNGLIWTDRSSGVTSALYSVIWTGTKYVAAGDFGRVLTSPNGVTWTTHDSGTFSSLKSLAFSGQTYVATGEAVIRISNDAITWRAPSNMNNVTAGPRVCWAHNRFLMSPFGGSWLANSSDGETWAAEPNFAGTVSGLTSMGGIAYVSFRDLSFDQKLRQSTVEGVWEDVGASGGRTATAMAWNGEALLHLDFAGYLTKGANLKYEILCFDPAASNVNENAGPAQTKVVRLGLATQARTVDFETVPGEATEGGDYVGLSGALTFAAGERQKPVAVTLVNDSDVEQTETFTVRLKNPSGSGAIATPSAHTFTVVDDEARPVLQFQAGTYTVSELSGYVDVAVVRSWDVVSPSSVSFTTTAGTALAGIDFASATGQLDFAAGETSKSIRIGILDNSYYDWARSFTLKLGPAATGSSLGTTTTATINLTNDDVAPAGLVILDALYGSVVVQNDVRSYVNANLVNNTVNMTVSPTTLGGDPAPGVAKTFFVRYQNADGHFSLSLPQVATLRLPSPQAQRLPMAYGQWATTRFNVTEQGDPLMSGDAADPNKNGIPNLMEYALNLDPKSATSPWDKDVLPEGEVTQVGAANRLTLSYRPNAHASNLAYIVEVSDDLKTWQSGADHVEQVSAAGALPIVMADKTPLDANSTARRFIRLRVVRD
ncbi:MAG TPA: Calx-beta domain-containing protein [Verrucomicrobium sp.]|nr:Calx-beta domain-containing protein [Verrucomicrobium sp.]